eukprot:CAMPEP_0181208404 /NCGR_PEP_ID=MMETSP1096-20121128/22099_1 /TAXON_ID=156174 ORGANISM="Chrysochromulina ericina, Strain CCMP281" /NCGR_SAMPLE_ID=MMETSP1096 /ASSEMBLY_ACC=CAM_ASM_000453 /LENGTH=207 /DNA_ID=CAMNT_0023299465 /DNA_START=31 /DNA_END=654 /DNA_ORIENTATION=+
MSWFEHIGKEMDGVIRTPEGDIMTMSYIGVLQAVPPVYDKLFPMAVAGIMKGDITNGCQVVTETMAEIPGGKGATLLGMIQHQITTLGPEQCDAAKTNGTKSLLWLNRAASFICRLLRLLSEGMESNDAAYKAYEEVLKPFHGWMTQQVVGNAVSLGPARAKIFELLDLTPELAAEQVPAFCDKMEALTADVLKMLVDNRANFGSSA